MGLVPVGNSSCSEGSCFRSSSVLLCFVGPGESLGLRGSLRLGCGYEHAKWSPASSITISPACLVRFVGEKIDAGIFFQACLQCIEHGLMFEKTFSRSDNCGDFVSSELVCDGWYLEGVLRVC